MNQFPHVNPLSLVYEWDVELVAAVDTPDLEEGEVVEHLFQSSYRDCVKAAAGKAPEGLKYVSVLVRDDDDRRAWAYIEDGVLPEVFTDADGSDYKRVPKKFHDEVVRV